MKTPFTHEYGRFSATKTIWCLFALVFLFQALLNGLTLTIPDLLTYSVTFNGLDAAAVLGAQGGIYAWRRHSECKFGPVPDMQVGTYPSPASTHLDGDPHA